MWALYLSSARLQQAADAAVLCGAAYLPANPALAESAARSKAQMNGIRENEIIYNRPASDGRSITMVVERNVPYRFARLLGLSQSLVTVKAVAEIGSSQSAAGVLPIGLQYGAHHTANQPAELKLVPLRGTASIGIDARGNINAEFLDFVTPDKFSRGQPDGRALLSVLMQVEAIAG